MRVKKSEGHENYLHLNWRACIVDWNVEEFIYSHDVALEDLPEYCCSFYDDEVWASCQFEDAEDAIAKHFLLCNLFKLCRQLNRVISDLKS